MKGELREVKEERQRGGSTKGSGLSWQVEVEVARSTGK